MVDASTVDVVCRLNQIADSGAANGSSAYRSCRLNDPAVTQVRLHSAPPGTTGHRSSVPRPSYNEMTEPQQNELYTHAPRSPLCPFPTRLRRNSPRPPERCSPRTRTPPPRKSRYVVRFFRPPSGLIKRKSGNPKEEDDADIREPVGLGQHLGRYRTRVVSGETG